MVKQQKRDGTEKKRRQLKPQEQREKIRWSAGSFTIEASLVMTVILLSFAFVIRFSLKLHDAVTGTAVLNEAMELQSHLSPMHAQAEEGQLDAYAANRLEGMLSEKRYEFTSSKKGRNNIGKISGKNYQAQLSDKGFHPEEWMRKLTLLDPLRE